MPLSDRNSKTPPADSGVTSTGAEGVESINLTEEGPQ